MDSAVTNVVQDMPKTKKEKSRHLVVSPWITKDELIADESTIGSSEETTGDTSHIYVALSATATRAAATCETVLLSYYEANDETNGPGTILRNEKEDLVGGNAKREAKGEQADRVHLLGPCILAVDKQNKLHGCAHLEEQKPSGQASCSGNYDIFFNGQMIKTYRDCTRDDEWQIALLCFSLKDLPDMPHTVYLAAESSGGDALSLNAPMKLMEDEVNALDSLLSQLTPFARGVEVSFSCSRLLGGAKAFWEIPKEFEDIVNAWTRQIDIGIDYINIGELCLCLPSKNASTHATGTG